MNLRSIAVAAAACALSFNAFADGHEEAESNLTDVWIFHVKSGHMPKFREGLEAFWEAREEAGDSATWYAYSAVVGNDINRVMYRRVMSGFGDMDTYEEEVSKMEIGSVFQDEVAPHIESTNRYLEQADMESSYWPESADGPFYGVTTWYLAEGGSPEASAARKTISEMLKDGWASDENNWMWMNRIGGKPVLQIVTSFSNWADMEEPETTVYDFMMEKMESEEEVMGMFNDFSKGKKGSDFTVWRLDEDMTYNMSDD